jgi:hypothetical protein
MSSGDLAVLALSTVSTLLGYHPVHGRATVYYPRDGHSGFHRADGRPFTRQDHHIAHRTLPLGTTGYLCSVRTSRCVLASVQDRGPFGAKRSCKGRTPAKARLIKYGRTCFYWQAQIRLKPGWARRGEFDLTRPVAKAIGHRPFDPVVFFHRLPRPES